MTRWGWIAAVVLLFAPLAHAVTCLATVTGVLFGVYSPFTSTPLDSTGTVTVTCITLVSTSETYTVKLSTGTSTTFNRFMTTGFSNMNYNIYTDSARSLIWGDGTSSTTFDTFSGTLPVGTTITNFTAYGRIASLQNAQIGIYADGIVVTVAY